MLIENDFSYRCYCDTILKLKKNHKFVDFESVSSDDIILRHDVDIALQPAVNMAKIENDLKVQSTYFILIHSPYYNPFSPYSTQMIRKILELGHKIGLHYDSSFYIKNNLDANQCIKNEIDIFNSHFQTKVNVVAAHNPTTNKKLEINFPDKIIDADSIEFKKNRKYISDSVQNWREGSFSKFVEQRNLYILIHPIWWTKDNKSRIEILQSLIGGDLDQYTKEIRNLKNFQDEYLNKLKNAK
jgi:hypothetical protein